MRKRTHLSVKQLFNESGVVRTDTACFEFRDEFSSFIKTVDCAVGCVVGRSDIEISVIWVNFK